ncbi:unnamed protein product, partial [marine sediment metagenome]
ESLVIGIGSQEINPANPKLDHPINCVAPTTSQSNNFE